MAGSRASRREAVRLLVASKLSRSAMLRPGRLVRAKFGDSRASTARLLPSCVGQQVLPSNCTTGRSHQRRAAHVTASLIAGHQFERRLPPTLAATPVLSQHRVPPVQAPTRTEVPAGTRLKTNASSSASHSSTSPDTHPEVRARGRPVSCRDNARRKGGWQFSK